MIITKYQHACFMVTHNDQSIVVDPGKFARDFTPSENTTAVVITHEHMDHFDIPTIQAIIQANPNVVIFAHPSVTEQLGEMNVHAVQPGDQTTIGDITLEFFGGQHATIHENLPVVANIGVLINNAVYYGGDSYALPNKPVTALALPVTAPWLRIDEALNFLKAVAPKIAFPTHDEIASDDGKHIVDNIIGAEAKKAGILYSRLTEPLTL